MTLVTVAKKGMPGEIAELLQSPHGILRLSQLENRLSHELGLQEQLARWAISTWSQALSVASEYGEALELSCPSCLRPFAGDGRSLGAIVHCPQANCGARLRICEDGKDVSVEGSGSNWNHVGGAIIRVATDGNGRFKSLDDALRESPEGATLELSGGPFVGSFLIKKSIALRSAKGEQGVVIVSRDKTCICVQSGELQISNLTIQMQPTSGVQRPAVEVQSGSALIHACNVQSTGGDAVKIFGPKSTAQFTHTTIQTERRGAIVVFDGACVELSDCAIRAPRGSGVTADGSATIKLNQCRIDGVGASGILSRDSELKIEYCSIERSKEYGISIRGGQLHIHASQVSNNGARGIWHRDNVQGVVSDCELLGNKTGAINSSDGGLLRFYDNSIAQ